MGDKTRGRPRRKKALKCPYCKQNNAVCFGFDKNNRQRYKCLACNKTFNERAGTAFYRARSSEKDITEAIHAYMRCANITAIAEIKGVKSKTLVGWIRKAAQKGREIPGFFFRSLKLVSMQLDELWSYVKSKSNEQWVWHAIAPVTKLLLAFHIGSWTKENAERFLGRLREIIAEVGIITTDGLEHYKELLLASFPEAMYAQVVKTRKGKKLESVHINVVSGDKELMEFNARLYRFGKTINTAYIERNNLTTRQNSSRLKRKTLAYSKSIGAMEDFQDVYLAYYNFVRKHKALKTVSGEERTPAMRAGLVNRVWTFRDLLTFRE